MNLLRAASTVSLLTLASRITGLVRETMVAALFGACQARWIQLHPLPDLTAALDRS